MIPNRDSKQTTCMVRSKNGCKDTSRAGKCHQDNDSSDVSHSIVAVDALWAFHRDATARAMSPPKFPSIMGITAGGRAGACTTSPRSIAVGVVFRFTVLLGWDVPSVSVDSLCPLLS